MAARPKTTRSTPIKSLCCCAAVCSAGLCLSSRDARDPRPAASTHAPGPQTRGTPGPCAQYQQPVYPPSHRQKDRLQTNRDGVAERFADPAVHKSIAVALALITSYDELLRDVELTIVKTAKHHDAHTLYLLHTVPGIGKILQPRAALRHPSDRPLPAGAGFRLLLPSGQVRQGIGGETFRHLRHQNRQCASHVGVLRSGRLIPPG